MKTILIADAGSTKVDWAVLTDNGEILARFTTCGINALLVDDETLASTMAEAGCGIPPGVSPDEIFYYGAGCATPDICKKMQSAIHNNWPEASISVNSDLLGAARSLFGHRKGIACILGTGSNSCLYDGNEITCQIPSLGYILGDEGSGAALGKRLVVDVFKQQLPEDIRDKFLNRYGLSLPIVLDKVYRSAAPNRFLASFVPFLEENKWNPNIYSLVLDELTNFVRRNVAMYPRAHSFELSFTGSIAAVFEGILREAAASQGYSISSISKEPMDGLVSFHCSQPL